MTFGSELIFTKARNLSMKGICCEKNEMHSATTKAPVSEQFC